jgi:outer membrane cobalamin receptor
MRCLRLACLALFLVLVPACASSGDSESRRSSDVITRDDVVETTAQDAWDVVNRLQPRWLQSRGRVSIQSERAGEPVVYVDGIRFGGVTSLRQIHVDAIEEIRRISAADATTRFGTGHAGGVIMVTTRR